MHKYMETRKTKNKINECWTISEIFSEQRSRKANFFIYKILRVSVSKFITIFSSFIFVFCQVRNFFGMSGGL